MGLSGLAILASILMPLSAAAQSGAPGERGVQSRAPTVGGCQPTRAKYIASDQTQRSTTSASFVNVPQGAVNIKQTKAGCVIVHFSASVYAPANGMMELRAVLDNVVGKPTSTTFIGCGDCNEERSGSQAMLFVFPSVAPGNHTVKMQWRSSGGIELFMFAHTTIVQHQ